MLDITPHCWGLSPRPGTLIKHSCLFSEPVSPYVTQPGFESVVLVPQFLSVRITGTQHHTQKIWCFKCYDYWHIVIICTEYQQDQIQLEGYQKAEKWISSHTLWAPCHHTSICRPRACRLPPASLTLTHGSVQAPSEHLILRQAFTVLLLFFVLTYAMWNMIHSFMKDQYPYMINTFIDLRVLYAGLQACSILIVVN